MSTTYKRKNHNFNERLAVRRDELNEATITVLPNGRVVLSALPAYTFPSQECAKQFVRRCLWSKPSKRREQ